VALIENKTDVKHLSNFKRLILASIVAVLWSSIVIGQTASSNTSSGASVSVAASTATSQSPDRAITGRGSQGSIPVFTSPSAIGPSALFQSPIGYIGVGTTTPETTFRVVNNENSINQFGLEPIGIYATASSSINNTAAIRGDFLASSGYGYGVEGLTYGKS
jgi:hypothetical protein